MFLLMRRHEHSLSAIPMWPAGGAVTRGHKSHEEVVPTNQNTMSRDTSCP